MKNYKGTNYYTHNHQKQTHNDACYTVFSIVTTQINKNQEV